MNRASPSLLKFAERLIAFDSLANKSTATKSPAPFPVCEKLRPQLALLMGNAGFHALISRSLALASREAPWLNAVHVKSDGCLEGLEELHAQLDPDKWLKGRVLLLAQLLGLLVAFIGESLTLRLVREVWPKLPNDMDLTDGD